MRWHLAISRGALRAARRLQTGVTVASTSRFPRATIPVRPSVNSNGALERRRRPIAIGIHSLAYEVFERTNFPASSQLEQLVEMPSQGIGHAGHASLEQYLSRSRFFGQ
jgi:hypothetical protein